MATEKKCSGFSTEIGDVLMKIDDIVPKPSEKSIANQLVTALDYSGFKERLQKCQKEVICVTSGTPSDEAKLCVFEVKVKPSRDGLDILTESGADKFCRELKELPKAFLVSSESVSMIEAKLAVYRKFKYDIDDKGIRIHHILDEPEDFLNHCGHFTIDSFQMIVADLKKSIPVAEVERIVKQAADYAFSWGKIRDTCREVYLVDKGDNIGTVRNRSYDCRSHFTVKRIKENLVSETLREIGKSFCNKIFQDILEHIRSHLEKSINADVHRINLSISDETFMKYSVHVAVVTVVVAMLFPIVGFMMATLAIVFTFVWSIDINSLEWRDKVAYEIYEQVEEKEESIVADVRRKIKGICEKTIEELHSAVTKLQSAKMHVCRLNQKQIAEEWMLRDICIEGMVKQPTILKIIGGRVDHRIKIKVFLTSADEEIKAFVRKHTKCVPKDTEFVFVDTGLKKNQSNLKEKEAKANPIDQEKRMKLHSIIEKEEDKLFAKHSNIIAIGTSPVRQVGRIFIEDPCIVIYCLDKELVPFGEKRLPYRLNGFPCDIREDFFLFGVCRENSHRIVHGCSIGNAVCKGSGSVGFLARQNANSKSGFLTAAHVALSSDILGQLNQKRLTEIPNVDAHGPFNILHPSQEDGHPHSVVIGEVTESYFGSYMHDNNDVGIDAAFVKFTNNHEEELYRRYEEDWDEQNHFLYPIEYQVARRKDVNIGAKVFKRGRTTDVTEGRLIGDRSLRRYHPYIEGAFLILKKCFEIQPLNGDKKVFFEGGDSGAGVFILEEDTRLQPLAIAFGSFTDDGITLACPLENVLSTLDVSI